MGVLVRNYTARRRVLRSADPQALTSGRVLLLARQAWRRGLRAVWHDVWISGQILGQSRNPYHEEPEGPLPVHVVGGIHQGLIGFWMLASWFKHTQRNWHVVWHDDGSMTPAWAGALDICFPGIEIIGRADADKEMARVLRGAPLCAAYRDALPLGLKAFDVAHFARHERFILLDTDLLFYARPEQVLNWVDSGEHSCWFNEDAVEPAPISYAAVRERMGFDLWHRVNSGLCLLTKQAIDFASFERWMADPDMRASKPWRVEQTLLALAASRFNKGGMLCAEYEITLSGARRTDAAVRHYVGIVRDLFFSEGVAQLRGVLCH
ncbi:MAG: hypothetical protein GKR94_02695 [Gammaproteobacteria bacterium]|nr:hypothetical protein [Gammaproteobacteria bacterium]